MGQQDSGTVAMVLLMVGIMAVLIFILLSSFFTNIQPMFIQLGAASVGTQISEQTKSAVLLFDALFAVIYAGLFIGTIFIAFISRSRPFYAILGILFGGVFIILSYGLQAIWQGFATSNSLVIAVMPYFTITNLIMNNLAFLIMLNVVSVMAVMFIKPTQDNMEAQI